MQSKPNIRWRKTDLEKLDREVKRFNAKLSRIKKNHPEMSDILPERVSKRELMENIKYRSTFNREMRSLDRFSRRGAEKPVTNKQGVTVTSWERKETGYKYAQWNRQLTMERKKAEGMDVTSQGKPTGLKRGEMGSVRMNALKNRKFDFEKVKSKREWDKLVARVEKNLLDIADHEKAERFKMNYIKGMSRVFGEHGEAVVRKIKMLPAEKVVELFYREQEASIDFIYDPLELIAKLDTIEDIWEDEFTNDPDSISYDNWSVENESDLSEWIENGMYTRDKK